MDGPAPVLRTPIHNRSCSRHPCSSPAVVTSFTLSTPIAAAGARWMAWLAGVRKPARGCPAGETGPRERSLREARQGIGRLSRHKDPANFAKRLVLVCFLFRRFLVTFSFLPTSPGKRPHMMAHGEMAQIWHGTQAHSLHSQITNAGYAMHSMYPGLRRRLAQSKRPATSQQRKQQAAPAASSI